MEKHFQFLRNTRTNMAGLLESCSEEQLFTIPEGFNNTILWNLIHVIVTHQLLLYGRTNTPFRIPMEVIQRFRRGTVPEGKGELELIDFAKEHLLLTVDWAEQDYQEGRFGVYQAWVTGYGATLDTVEDAIIFNNIHEGMHYGQIKMLQRLV